MKALRFNWPIWAAFLLSVVGFLSFPTFFVRFPETRDFPWANLLLFAIAAAFLIVGVRRGFVPDRSRPTRSKIAASVLALICVAILGFFIFSMFVLARRLPASHGAPQVTQKAPDFTLSDSNDKSVSLSELVSAPVKGKTPKGVLLVFYRGYW